ncbi:hypothetical protein CNMCM5793_001415 [Aspergillus hiratsukae]|uniref:Uncharacterized protein n=1 Tax=Aspergillus hiratsukae TaxID=1194566 RepID=A0A8H6Q1A9_9EURO|nr:hypothetical protein CNMCM5793_001415 [Aspergillus hiratsukae]KAF7164636.1 hypothetical protein CNMCM6106_001088 [Aspergillus hiratsukae]
MAPFTVGLLKASQADNIEPRPETLFPSTYRTGEGNLTLVKSNEGDFLACVRALCRQTRRYLWTSMDGRASDAASAVTPPNRPAKGDNNLREDGYALSLGQRADIPQANPAISPFSCFLGDVSGKNAAPKRRRIALGFLFTYAALLSFESDFVIAKERGLLPSNLDISRWRTFVEEIITPSVYKDIHRRFHYGELRLGRLNSIFLFTGPGYYMDRWPNYSSFLRDQLGWLATATIYIAVVLTAMQVGLATDQLKANAPYMAAAYGFSVFAILGPLISGGVILFALVIVVAINWKFQKAKSAKRFRCIKDFENGTIDV